MTSDDARRWRARPVLSGLLRAVVVLLPLVVSTLVVVGIGRVLPADAARSWTVLAALLVVALLVAVVVERLARRLMPLTVLLRLTMLFPDRAPSRYAVARRAVAGPAPDELIWSDSDASPVSAAEVVLSLVGALGAHDRKTRGHSERVRVLCDVLACELRLDDDARDRLRWAALLHDIGKMTVSPRVLNKPSRLDAQEFAVIKEHPEAGAALAAPLLPWLGEWGLGIVDHHEKYDGTGYPAGKSAGQISEAGRIVGLVDAFETMTAHRPYKRAMAHRAAREELARCSGTHFDPVMVRAFLATSLPRVLWTMGPLSFLLQVPFLRSIADAGARTGAVTGQVAAGAGNAAALATAGAAVVGATVAGALPPAPLSTTTTPVAQLQAPPLALGAPAPPSGAGSDPAAAPLAPAPLAPAPGPAPVPATGAEPAATPSPVPTPAAEPRSVVPRPDDSRSDEAPDPQPGPTATAPAPAPEPVQPRTPPAPAEPAGVPAGQPGPTDPPAPTAAPPEEPAPAPEPTTAEPTTAEPTTAPSPTTTASPTEPTTGPTAPTAGPTTEPTAAPSPTVTPTPEAVPAPAPDEQARATTLTSTPPSRTSSRTATFTMTSPRGSAFECRLRDGDGGGSDEGGWTDCTSPVTYEGLEPGVHTFRVRSVGDGGKGKSTSYTWEVVDEGSAMWRSAQLLLRWWR